MSRSLLRLALLFLIVVAMVPAARAQVPEGIAYQGYLTDSNSTPINDDDATLTFRLYDAATDGTVQWIETQTGVVINQGIFAVQLGSVEALTPSMFDVPLFLSVAIGDASAEELSPRVPLVAAPYSLRAARLDTAALKAGANVSIAPDPDGALVISSEGGGNGSDAWQLDGNAGTDPATNFLGTTDDVPMEIRVNGARIMRYEPETADDGPSVIGGGAATASRTASWEPPSWGVETPPNHQAKRVPIR